MRLYSHAIIFCGALRILEAVTWQIMSCEELREDVSDLSNSFCLSLNLLETGSLNHPIASKLLIFQALNTIKITGEKRRFGLLIFSVEVISKNNSALYGEVCVCICKYCANLYGLLGCIYPTPLNRVKVCNQGLCH